MVKKPGSYIDFVIPPGPAPATSPIQYEYQAYRGPAQYKLQAPFSKITEVSIDGVKLFQTGEVPWGHGEWSFEPYSNTLVIMPVPGQSPHKIGSMLVIEGTTAPGISLGQPPLQPRLPAVTPVGTPPRPSKPDPNPELTAAMKQLLLDAEMDPAQILEMLRDHHLVPTSEPITCTCGNPGGGTHQKWCERICRRKPG